MVENFETMEIVAIPDEVKAMATEEQMATIEEWIEE